MSDDLNIRFKKFVDTYWPLPEIKNQMKVDDIINFKRQVWYCNCSKKFIPELQKFNECQISFEYKPDKLLCSNYYKKGYTNYRVYKNGLAFLDIHIIGMLFDYFESPYITPKPKTEDLIKFIESLAYDNPFGNLSNRNEMYNLFNNFNSGTVVLRSSIPVNVIKYIVSEYKDGDVIDTYGYRGVGLYIKDGNKFKKVKRNEYYPIWDLKFLKLIGYRYYLKDVPCTTYDELNFENGIYHEYFGYFSNRTKNNLTEYEKLEPTYYIKKENNVIKYNNGKKWIDLLLDENQFYNIPYPFITPDQPNSLIKTDLAKTCRFRAKISNNDYLVFANIIYITDINDEDDIILNTGN